MGRGCAREATQRIPGIATKLASLIEEHGNRPMRICRYEGADIASFPVKHHWKEEADPALIENSARALVEMADKFGYNRIVIPRPGCGNGRLSYEHDVRPLLTRVLDERFTIVSK